jgi:G patch domain-containing protein 1
LNDAEDEDVDVYDSGAGHRPSRGLAYDAREGPEKMTLGSHRDRPPLRPRDDPTSTSQNTFHDGRPVLMDFVVSDEPIVEDVWCDNDAYITMIFESHLWLQW